MKVSIFFVYILMSFLFLKSQAQVMTKQIDSVVYEDYKGNFFSLQMQKSANICVGYIHKYYRQNNLRVYLDISDKKDSSDLIELGYDNLYGNALENETYDRISKYHQLGI